MVWTPQNPSPVHGDGGGGGGVPHSHGILLVVLKRLLGHDLHEAGVLPGDVPGHGEGQRLRIEELHRHLRVGGGRGVFEVGSLGEDLERGETKQGKLG